MKLRVASAHADKSLYRFLAESLEQTLFPVPSALSTTAKSQRNGIAKGQFVVPDSIDGRNPEIATLFNAVDKRSS